VRQQAKYLVRRIPSSNPDRLHNFFPVSSYRLPRDQFPRRLQNAKAAYFENLLNYYNFLSRSQLLTFVNHFSAARIFTVRIGYLQHVLSGIQLIHVGYRKSQQTIFLIHSDTIGGPKSVAVAIPLEIRLRITRDARGKLARFYSLLYLSGAATCRLSSVSPIINMRLHSEASFLLV